MQLDRDGARHFPAVFSPDQAEALQALFSSCAGSARIGQISGFRSNWSGQPPSSG